MPARISEKELSMFGYIVAHTPELKVREYEAYKASYCGLCKSLKERHGRLGQMTLTFDMTFLALLLTGLYEPQQEAGRVRCIAHPLRAHHYRRNIYYDYAADMNVLLSYYKCVDDWQDERRLSRLLFSKFLGRRIRKVESLYPRKCRRVRELLDELGECERKKLQDIDKTAGFFGEIMAELFLYCEDQWEPMLRRMGFYFGKFIYLMDAYEDIEEDLKKGSYNPLLELYKKENFEQECQQILKMMMAETSRAFELLPILEEAGILRNILYAGVWSRYGQVSKGRKERFKKEYDDGSV